MNYEEVRAAEESVRYEAGLLAHREEDLATEYLRLVATGIPTWQAQKQAELALLGEVTKQRAEYEIAVARLRR